MKRILSLLLLLLLCLPGHAEEMSTEAMLRQVEGLQDLIAFRRPSNNATLRYANNQVATNLYGTPNATWRWPNGQVLSNLAGSPNATWYWPNGRVMTNQIGSRNATWYWPDGQVMMLSGGGFSEEELRDTPAVGARVLHLVARRGY